ncbi:hypothetical protein AK830_g1043 [Neonectria ditissima]|uniref:Uncharacterized protein n=1 Tax=Neonectria ditissima TaxID=78410 RepID=A0A0P7BVK9_9HYPO|nr:hypothetical protein AK830_g1043 [Neonectria ditissima]
MPEFEFVVSDGTVKRPSAALRSHAVKSGLHRKSQAKVASGPRDSQLTVRQKDSLKGRFKLSGGASNPKRNVKAVVEERSSQSKSHGPVTMQPEMADDSVMLRGDAGLDTRHDQHLPPSTQPQVVRTPSQGRGDPFGTFLVPLTSDAEKLVKFFISRFELPVPIASIQRQWWDYALSDPLVMHATLGLAAATWSTLVYIPKQLVYEGYKQKGMALREVQERLTTGSHSLALVGAIANLASTEGCEAAFATARVHLMGLDLLVKTWAGGYDALKSNINVARVVNWADIQAANGLGVRPLIPMIFSLNSITLPTSVIAAAEEPSLSHLKIFEKDSGSSTIESCFSLVRQGQYSVRNDEVPRHDFGILINAVDHFLADILGGDNISGLGRILLTAAHIAYYTIVRGVPPIALLPRIIARRLRKQLDTAIPIISSCPEFQHGLIWCLLIGSAVAYETGEDWDVFSTDLCAAVQSGKIQGPLELEEIARRFVWHQQFPGAFLGKYCSTLFPRLGNDGDTDSLPPVHFGSVQNVFIPDAISRLSLNPLNTANENMYSIPAVGIHS